MHEISENKDFFGKAFVFCLYAMVFFISFNRTISTGFIILWFILVIISFVAKKNSLTPIFNLQKFIFITQILMFMIILSGILYGSKNSNFTLQISGQRLSMLVFPMLFYFSFNRLTNKNLQVFLFFITGSFLATLLCYANAINDTFIHPFVPFAKSGFYNFYYSLFSFFIHPSYFSMYLNFVILILFYFIDNQKKGAKIIANWLIYFLIVYFSFTIYLLSSRAGLITLVVIILWRIIRFYFQKRQWLIKLSLIGIFIIFIALLSQNRRVEVLYKQIESSMKSSKETKDTPSRIFIWKNAIEVIKQHFIFGTSPADAQEYLDKNMKKNNIFPLALAKHFNAHNQYLQTFLESGLIGFLLLISVFVSSIIFAIKQKNILFAGFLFIVLFNIAFDSMFTGSAGIIFIFLFLNFFIFAYNKDFLTTEGYFKRKIQTQSR